MSAESGVPTFRGPGGLWREHRPEDLATPGAFARDPRLVWEWYDWRRRLVLECRPHDGHRSIAEAQARARLRVVTQNVDGLHERALRAVAGPDTTRVLALHGSLFRIRCQNCSYARDDDARVDAEELATLPRCPECTHLLRPGVVWFGEMLDSEVLETAFEWASEADVCVVAGTSALVEPAASLPRQVLAAGGAVIEVNTEPTPLTRVATYAIMGKASQEIPRLMDALTGSEP